LSLEESGLVYWHEAPLMFLATHIHSFATNGHKRTVTEQLPQVADGAGGMGGGSAVQSSPPPPPQLAEATTAQAAAAAAVASASVQTATGSFLQEGHWVATTLSHARDTGLGRGRAHW
jgi:hypothetical protein